MAEYGSWEKSRRLPTAPRIDSCTMTGLAPIQAGHVNYRLETCNRAWPVGISVCGYNGLVSVWVNY